jgi:hypothetical protein
MTIPRAAFGWLIGFTLVAIPIWQTVKDLDLRTCGVEATVLRVEAPPPGSKGPPSVFIADTNGRELGCHGWGIEVGDTMLYDPQDRRCRAAAQVGWPGPEQWLILGGGLFLLSLGAVTHLMAWRKGRRAAST